MKKTSQFNKKVHMAKKDKGFYVVISKSILDLDLNAGQKITLATIVSLAKKSGKCTATTRTLADMVGVSKRTMQNYISFLISKELMLFTYVGQNRHYTPLKNLVDDNDAKAIITSDILKSSVLTTTYKLAQGLLIAKGLNNDNGGYNWNSMRELAQYFGVSLSSAYRYINKLIDARTIERSDKGKYLFISKDLYTRKQNVKTKESKDLLNRTNIPIDPHVTQVLDELYKSMRG